MELTEKHAAAILKFEDKRLFLHFCWKFKLLKVDISLIIYSTLLSTMLSTLAQYELN